MAVSEESKIVEDGYNQIADIYHSLRLAKKDLNYQYFDNLFHFFPKSGKVLDLGCGGGQPLTAYFADKGFDVTGVDLSRAMIEIAKRKFPREDFLFPIWSNANLTGKNSMSSSARSQLSTFRRKDN